MAYKPLFSGSDSSTTTTKSRGYQPLFAGVEEPEQPAPMSSSANVETYSPNTGGEFQFTRNEAGKMTPYVTDRNISTNTKNEVRGGNFADTQAEVDHIMSKFLGGTDNKSNLEPATNVRSIAQKLYDFVTGNKREVGDYKKEDRQGGKYAVEDKVYKMLEKGEISFPQAVGAVAHWENPKPFIGEKDDFKWDYENSKLSDKAADFIGRLTIGGAKMLAGAVEYAGDNIYRLNPLYRQMEAPISNTLKVIKREAAKEKSEGEKLSILKLTDNAINFYENIKDKTNAAKYAKEQLDKLYKSDVFLDNTDGYKKAAESGDWKALFTTHLPETMFTIGPDIVSSIGVYVLSGGAAPFVIGASTAQDIKDTAIDYGVDKDVANNLGLLGGVTIAWLDKIIPEKTLSGEARKKFMGGLMLRFAKNSLGEAATEMAQENVQLAIEATFRDDLGWDEVKTRNALAGFGGALGGGGMSILGDIQTKMNDNVDYKINPQNKVQVGLEIDSTNEVDEPFAFKKAPEVMEETQLDGTMPGAIQFNSEEFTPELQIDEQTTFDDIQMRQGENLEKGVSSINTKLTDLNNKLNEAISGGADIDTLAKLRREIDTVDSDFKVKNTEFEDKIFNQTVTNISSLLKNSDIQLPKGADLNAFAKSFVEEVVVKPEISGELNLLEQAKEYAKTYKVEEVKPAKYQNVIANRIISPEQAVREVKSVLGDAVRVEVVNSIIDPNDSTSEAIGAYFDEVIQFTKQPDATTPKHEALHAYFDMFVDSKRKRNILNQVKNEQNLESDVDAEEWLADAFVRYARGERSFSQKIKNFLGYIWTNLKKLAGKEDKIKALFQEIEFDNKAKKVSAEKSKTRKFQKKEKKAEEFEGFDDLSTKILNKLKGRTTVSKQFISDLTNSGDLKQVERDLIRTKLEKFGDEVSVKEFADGVKNDLLPLKVTSSFSGKHRYGTELDDSNFFSPKFESISLPSEIRGEIDSYKENIYESPIQTSAGGVHFSGESPNYFGHTRVEDMADGDTRRIIEVQSDLYQKGRLESEMNRFEPETIDYTSGERKVIPAQRLDLTKEKSKLLQYNDPTAHFRMIREEVKRAATDSKSVLQFPTGETAMKIEGLGQTNQWYVGEARDYITQNEKLVPNRLKVGEEVFQGYGNDKWIITDVLGDGKFKAVPKPRRIEKIDGVDAYYYGDKAISFENYKQQFAESFDISDKVDTGNPIYKFYEKEVGRYLKNNYDAKPVTDDQGVTWWEVAVNSELADKPVMAFQKKPLSEERKFKLEIQRYEDNQARQIKELEEDYEIMGAREVDLTFGDGEKDANYKKFSRLAKRYKFLLDNSVDADGVETRYKSNERFRNAAGDKVDYSLFSGAHDVTNNELLELLRDRYYAEMRLKRIASMKTNAEKEIALKKKIEKTVRAAEVGKTSAKFKIRKAITGVDEKTVTMTESQLLKQGFRIQARTGKEVAKNVRQEIRNRQAKVSAIKDYFGLNDKDLRTVSQRDIRYMTNYEFWQFLQHLRAKAFEIADKRQLTNELVTTINQLELKRVDNYRQALKLPQIANMTPAQVKQFHEAIAGFEIGDEFLSTRIIELIDRTDLKNARTYREAYEGLAKKLGTNPEEVKGITASNFDRVLTDSALANRNPFYKLLVTEFAAHDIQAVQNVVERKAILNKLTKAARKSVKKGVTDILIPQDKAVFNWLSSEVDVKKELAKNMSKEELELAYWLRDEFAQMRNRLVEQGTLNKWKENYITHRQRNFLEALKDDGIKAAFTEMFEREKMQQEMFEIIDNTGEILPLEKFFANAMQRTGVVEPTKNVAKAYLGYLQSFERKMALDAIVPEVMAYVRVLTPQAETPRGLLKDTRLETFVKEWINTKKGRTRKMYLRQGEAADTIVRGLNTMVTMIDLGFSIPVGLASKVGENMSNWVDLGTKKVVVGKIRRLGLQKSKAGRELIKAKLQGFTGENPFVELINDASQDMGDKTIAAMFSLFKAASYQANLDYLLGSLSSAEWQALKSGGELPARFAEVKTEMGRFRAINGSDSVFGATTEMKILTKYKTWAIPHIESQLKNIKTIKENIQVNGIQALKNNQELGEVLRGTIYTVAIALLLHAVFSTDDEDETFYGKLKQKILRESMTSLSAFDPSLWLQEPRLLGFLSDVVSGLKALVQLEKYKSTTDYVAEGDLKGVEMLKKTLTPAIIKQVMPKEKREEVQETDDAASRFYRENKKDHTGLMIYADKTAKEMVGPITSEEQKKEVTKFKNQIIKDVIGKYGDEYESIISANSNADKAVLLAGYKSSMAADEFNTMITTLKKFKFLSEDAMTKYRKALIESKN